MRFVPITQVSTFGSAWTKVAFQSDTAIVYTKTDSTNGPIGTTLVGIKPCLDPSEVMNYDESYYPLEVKQGWMTCTIDLPDYPAEDPRFRLIENY